MLINSMFILYAENVIFSSKMLLDILVCRRYECYEIFLMALKFKVYATLPPASVTVALPFGY